MRWSRIKDVRHSLKNNGAEAAAKQKDPKQFSSSVVCLHVGVAVCACVGIFDVRPEVCYTKQQRLKKERANIEPNRTAKRTQKKTPSLPTFSC